MLKVMLKRTNKKYQKRNIGKKALVAAGILLMFLLGGFWYWRSTLKMPDLPEPSLRDLAAERGVDLGVLTYAHRLDDPIYAGIIRTQFEFATIDGGAHFSEIRPTPTETDYRTVDTIVEFAEENSMNVQLHHLVWGDRVVLPQWLTEGDHTKEELLKILEQHITETVSRYKGRIREYTVINEATTEAQHIYGLKSWWQEKLGDDPKLIDNYFRWAHRADPEAKLIMNDFYNETKNSTSDAMYAYIKDAKARGVPIHGVGMQLHVDASRPPEKKAVIENMRRFAALGTPVYITEFDVNTNSVKGSAAYKSQLESQITYDMVRACVESRACVSFTVFGVTSKNDLIKKITRANTRAYLFDSRYRPRPSFYDFLQAWQKP